MPLTKMGHRHYYNRGKSKYQMQSYSTVKKAEET